MSAGWGSAAIDGPPDAVMIGTGTLPTAGHAVHGVVAFHHVASPVVEVGDAVEVNADVGRRIGDEAAAPAEVVPVWVGRRCAQRWCGRGSRRASGRGRPVRRCNHSGRRRRVGRCRPRRRWWGRRWWGRRCRGGGGGSRRRGWSGGRRGYRESGGAGGWSRWLGDQHHQAKQGQQCDSRQGGDDLLPPVPRAVGAGPRRRWCAPLRWRWWLLALWWSPCGRPPGLRWRCRSRWWLGRWLVGLLRSPAVWVHPSVGHGRPTFEGSGV
jgi:hypothetical protein